VLPRPSGYLLPSRIRRHSLIVIGGPQVPDKPEAFLREHPFVDLVVHNEGERTFFDLVDRFPEHRWDDLAGVSYIDPAGRFVYAANVTANNQVAAYSITPSSGALTASGAPAGAGLLPVSIIVDPSGLFAYVANDNSNDISVYAVDSSTGVLTQASHSPFAAGNEPRSIAID